MHQVTKAGRYLRDAIDLLATYAYVLPLATAGTAARLPVPTVWARHSRRPLMVV